ncbi:MAG: protein tyrosine phosphatase [Polyangiaceae bacterium]|nr:protein tyrosine phosphatase [Polyangiaceae bacterium]
MKNFVDLHCHWIPKIDDGARTKEEGLAILKGLKSLGFGRVAATPHMRPGLFELSKGQMETAFDAFTAEIPKNPEYPEVFLGSEHFFDAQVLARIHANEGVPWQSRKKPVRGVPEGVEPDLDSLAPRAILVEFEDLLPAPLIEKQLFELQAAGFLPVIAHPERYRACWKDLSLVKRLLDLGNALLLDVCSLVGKYGFRPRRTAWKMLDANLYDAACSDAHRPKDIRLVAESLKKIEAKYGGDELEFLFSQGPEALLRGKRPEC